MVFKKDLVVLQLSVRYCNNGGAINPEKPPQKRGGFSKKARKKAKRAKKPRNVINRAN